MLRSMKDLLGYRLIGTDGELGQVEDFYFDPSAWTVQYLVAHPGMLFPDKRHVLLSPQAIHQTDGEARALSLSLTDRQVREGPDLDPDDPLARQHLRSARAVIGHPLQATDDELGHVDDFLVEDETWALRYLVVDTRNWWFGRKLLISPRWVEELDSPDGKVHLGLSREELEDSPELDPALLPIPEDELHLHARPRSPVPAPLGDARQ